MKKNALILEKVFTLDKSQEFKSQDEILDYMETMGNDDFLSLQFREVVDNPLFGEEQKNIFSPAVFLTGHSKHVQVKETTDLVFWQNAPKLGFIKMGVTLGQIVEGYHAIERFIPWSELSIKNGCLDALGNVVVEPLSNPSTGEVLLYGTDKQPFARIVEPVKSSEYIPRTFNTREYSGIQAPFKGVKRGENNRKTSEYTAYLNALYAEYTNSEETPVNEIHKELVIN